MLPASDCLNNCGYQSASANPYNDLPQKMAANVFRSIFYLSRNPWCAPLPSKNRPNLDREELYPSSAGEYRAKVYDARMDEGRKRVIGIMAAILASLDMQTADDLFGGPQGIGLPHYG